MGLFDSLVSVATSAMVGNSEQGQAIQLITQLVQQNGGDIGGLLGQLQQGGLGDALQSWIGNGANQAVSGGDYQNALDNHLQQAAQSVGLNVDDAGCVVAIFAANHQRYHAKRHSRRCRWLWFGRCVTHCPAVFEVI